MSLRIVRHIEITVRDVTYGKKGEGDPNPYMEHVEDVTEVSRQVSHSDAGSSNAYEIAERLVSVSSGNGDPEDPDEVHFHYQGGEFRGLNVSALPSGMYWKEGLMSGEVDAVTLAGTFAGVPAAAVVSYDEDARAFRVRISEDDGENLRTTEAHIEDL